MIAEKQTKCANYIRIVAILKNLRDSGKISSKEYGRAKNYYRNLTGAYIVIAD